jgi:formylglycine-generating enzyme required for sulfatase activity
MNVVRFTILLACFVAGAAAAAPRNECFMLQKLAYVEPLTGLPFVRVPGGEFAMGSPAGEAGRQPDEVLHRVRLSPFLLSSTEVTQAQWTKVMGNNPSSFRDAGADAPVEGVTWNDVQDFLSRLNARGDGRFRLPTEAEWEYAARAGSTTAYAFGDHISTRQANYDGETPFRVGSFAPNAWGLYDMHGNVWEWCADEHCPYPTEAVTNPVNACGSKYKVIRGGSFHFGADSARSALRYTHEPHQRGFSIGFRVVRELEQ